MDLQGFNPVARPLLTASVSIDFLVVQYLEKTLKTVLISNGSTLDLLQAKGSERIVGGPKVCKTGYQV